jgi:hypothetical protein
MKFILSTLGNTLLHTMMGVVVFLLVCAGLAQAGLRCDGNDDVSNAGVNANTFLGTGEATITVWVKPTGSATSEVPTANNGQGILGEGAGKVGLFRSTMGGVDQLWGFNSTAGDNAVGTTFTNNAWTHLAWVQRSTGLTLYKDGVSVGTNPSATTISASLFNLKLCNMFSGTTPTYLGELEDMHTFSTALTASQIEVMARSQLFLSGPGGETGRWPFTTCPDGASGHGVNFQDTSGFTRPFPGDQGPDSAGLLCTGSSHMAWPGGSQ